MTPRYEPLAAGPLRATWDPANGQLRWIMLGDQEIVRGIYGAVRDQHWGTVEPSLFDVRTERGPDRFRIVFRARATAAAVDFEWTGDIVGDADGTISYSFTGQPLAEFLRQRIGLCVLHPIEECRGQPCRIIHTDGAIETTSFPVHVSPHQPFRDIAAIAQDHPDGVTVSIQFDGETFETEDQRNWTDASYKTYCIPLDRPRPVAVRPGDIVRQVVVVRLAGSGHHVPQNSAQVIPLDIGPSIRVPWIGFELTERAQEDRLLQQLRTLRPDHLRVSLDPESDSLVGDLQSAAGTARSVGAKLHLAFALGPDADESLRRLAAAVGRLEPPVAAWVVFDRDGSSTAAASVEKARRALAAVTSGSLFGGGTDQNFAELNRDRRPRSGFDVASFPMNPQVHAFDEDSIAETLKVQGDVIATARTFLGSIPIVAGPIVLDPRFTPDGQSRVPVSGHLDAPFSAAWTLGSVAALATAGCEFATYFEAFGPRGLFHRTTGAAGAGSSPAAAVFEALAELRAARWSRLDCRARTPLAGLFYRTDQSQGVLLANPGRNPVRAKLPFDVHRQRRLETGLAERDWEPVTGREVVVPPHRSIRFEGQLS